MIYLIKSKYFKYIYNKLKHILNTLILAKIEGAYALRYINFYLALKNFKNNKIIR